MPWHRTIDDRLERRSPRSWNPAKSPEPPQRCLLQPVSSGSNQTSAPPRPDGSFPALDTWEAWAWPGTRARALKGLRLDKSESFIKLCRVYCFLLRCRPRIPWNWGWHPNCSICSTPPGHRGRRGTTRLTWTRPRAGSCWECQLILVDRRPPPGSYTSHFGTKEESPCTPCRPRQETCHLRSLPAATRTDQCNGGEGPSKTGNALPSALSPSCRSRQTKAKRSGPGAHQERKS